MIHRPLVGMSELIDLKRIVVYDPGAAQIASNRLRCHLEGGRLVQHSTGEIECRVHRQNLDHRKNVALVISIVLQFRVFILPSLVDRCLRLRHSDLISSRQDDLRGSAGGACAHCAPDHNHRHPYRETQPCAAVLHPACQPPWMHQYSRTLRYQTCPTACSAERIPGAVPRRCGRRLRSVRPLHPKICNARNLGRSSMR